MRWLTEPCGAWQATQPSFIALCGKTNGPFWAVWHLVQVSFSASSEAPVPLMTLPSCGLWQSEHDILPFNTPCELARLNSPRFSVWHWKQASGDFRGFTI